MRGSRTVLREAGGENPPAYSPLGVDQYGTYSRAGARGKRLRASIPHGHWKTTTFVTGELLHMDGGQSAGH